MPLVFEPLDQHVGNSAVSRLVRYWWRILAKAVGEKAHQHSRVADQVAMVRLFILGGYMITNVFICAGVIRHWNG
jgi:hypothetical protein